MGCERESGTRRSGSANVDPQAQAWESPIHSVRLDAFLSSRFEMPQGQWLRATGENPSRYRPGYDTAPKGAHSARECSFLCPVEQVSWTRCAEVLRELALEFPTEAQREHAARAGTTTVFWTGNDDQSLAGKENIADQAFKSLESAPPEPQYAPWDDGHALHAPAGRFPPNPFGLHDVLGNVCEWARDVFVEDAYSLPWRQGDGLRLVGALSKDEARVHRAGHFYYGIERSRSCRRIQKQKDYFHFTVGVRPIFPLRRRV
jgi:formylglycine-generating enzyme required for sulfatase activity